MRWLGMMLVLIGALVLGVESFGRFLEPREGIDSVEAEHKDGVPPVLGGMAVVGGLLVLVTNGRRG